MLEEDIKLTEGDIMAVVTIHLDNYVIFENDWFDLINASKLSRQDAEKIVRKRYKEFIIN